MLGLRLMAKKELDAYDRKDITFVFVGYNRSDWDIPSNMITVGYVSSQDKLAEYYSMADLYVCTSLADTFPTTCLNALGCGTPLLGFKAGGVPYCASEPYGTFVEVKADFDNAGSSGSKSLGLLEYITSSTSILGEGIFCSYEDIKTGGHNNIGYISSFIIVVFYICMLVASLSNLLSRKFICHVIGLATTYFCLHSLKYGIVLFKYNYLFFFVLILAYSNCYKKNCLKLLY